MMGAGHANAQQCEPSYPDICVPPAPPKLGCDDISDRDFRVQGEDPHGFDRDRDGIGCESSDGPAEPTSAPTLGATATVLGGTAGGATPGPAAGPDAGGGPPAPVDATSPMMAGLLGAGLAWLIAGLAVVALVTGGPGPAIAAVNRRLTHKPYSPRLRPRDTR
jgi:hypothetical protein